MKNDEWIVWLGIIIVRNIRWIWYDTSSSLWPTEVVSTFTMQ